MKNTILSLFISVLFLSSALFGQDALPKEFEFIKTQDGTYQLQPKEEIIFQDERANEIQQFIIIVSKPDLDLYSIVIYYIHSDQNEDALSKQINPSIQLTSTNAERKYSNFTLEKRRFKKFKIEYVSFPLSQSEFQDIEFERTLVSFGNIFFKFSQSNYYALNFYRSSVNSYLSSKSRTSKPVYSSPSSSGGSVQVRGYTRKDGTYVKPHSRSAPRKKP